MILDRKKTLGQEGAPLSHQRSSLSMRPMGTAIKRLTAKVEHCKIESEKPLMGPN